MRTPIIAGNWKMNKTAAEAVDFVREPPRSALVPKISILRKTVLSLAKLLPI
jgi:triosephosphate isomerase